MQCRSTNRIALNVVSDVTRPHVFFFQLLYERKLKVRRGLVESERLGVIDILDADDGLKEAFGSGSLGHLPALLLFFVQIRHDIEYEEEPRPDGSDEAHHVASGPPVFPQPRVD